MVQNLMPSEKETKKPSNSSLYPNVSPTPGKAIFLRYNEPPSPAEKNESAGIFTAGSKWVKSMKG